MSTEISGREAIIDTITFNKPKRLAVDPFLSAWSMNVYPDESNKLVEKYPTDTQIISTEGVYNPSKLAKGNPWVKGISYDSWGCKFDNVHDGVVGEVKEAPIPDEDMFIEEAKKRAPYEMLPTKDQEAKAIDAVKRHIDNAKGRFTFSGCPPHPWERYQFLRGPEEAYADVAFPEDVVPRLKVLHDFYMKKLEFWAKTDVDSFLIADDWGSQTSLLISPKTWQYLFKPLYKDYCDLAKSVGKYVFFHSDGYIMDIYEDLIEIGVNAINSQVFCMPMEEIARRFKGRITFWGEIDRQHVLVSPNLEDGTKAMQKAFDLLWDEKGGYIAQFEFTAGSNPKMPMHLLDTAQRIYKEKITK